MGTYFYQNGVQFQDKVGFLLDNSYASTLLFIGAMYHGITIVPINVLAGKKQITYTIDHSDCKLLFSSKLYLNEFKTILRDSGAVIVPYENTQDLKISIEKNFNPLVVGLNCETPSSVNLYFRNNWSS